MILKNSARTFFGIRLEGAVEKVDFDGPMGKTISGRNVVLVSDGGDRYFINVPFSTFGNYSSKWKAIEPGSRISLRVRSKEAHGFTTYVSTERSIKKVA